MIQNLDSTETLSAFCFSNTETLRKHFQKTIFHLRTLKNQTVSFENSDHDLTYRCKLSSRNWKSNFLKPLLLQNDDAGLNLKKVVSQTVPSNLGKIFSKFGKRCASFKNKLLQI